MQIDCNFSKEEKKALILKDALERNRQINSKAVQADYEFEHDEYAIIELNNVVKEFRWENQRLQDENLELLRRLYHLEWDKDIAIRVDIKFNEDQDIFCKSSRFTNESILSQIHFHFYEISLNEDIIYFCN